MRPRLLFILLLLWLATPLASGHARLTLGAAPEATPELSSVEQAELLAAALGRALGEEVELRIFNSREELDQWLLKFTMLDLAIYDAAFLAERPGKYLVIGAADGAGKLFITSRQGVAGDLPQRVARALQQPLAAIKGKPSARADKQAPQQKPVKSKPAVQAATPPPTPTSTTRPEPPPAPPTPPLPATAAKAESATTTAAPAPPPVPAVPPGKMLPPTPHAATAKSEPPPAAPPAPQVVVPPAAAAPVGKPEEPSPAPPPEPITAKSYRAEPPPVAPPPPLIFPELPGELEAPPPSLKVAERSAPTSSQATTEAPKRVKPVVPAVAPVGETPKVAEATAEPVKGAAPESASPKPIEEVKPVEVARPVTAPAVEQPAKPEATAPIPVAVDKAAPPEPEAPAEQAASAPEQQEPSAIAKAAEPPKPPKRVKPVLPAAPPSPPTPAEPATVEPVPVIPPPATATPPAAPAEDQGKVAEPVKPVASPAVAAVPTTPPVPVPVAVDAPVKTVSVARPEPAGVTATPPPAEQIATETPLAESVPNVIAQPDIPQELRPPGVPAVRPTKLPMPLPSKEEDKLLAAKLPEKIGRTQKKAPLLPPPDPEPEIVYVVPFITLMVPDAVRERIFDQFVDKLNASGANRKLRFVILKEPLEKIDREWLDARKYVFGEIFGYVEDSGCCSTDLRAKARLTYYRAHHPEPSLRYEFPIRTFFEHTQTTIEAERNRVADQIANALVAELTKALQQ